MCLSACPCVRLFVEVKRTLKPDFDWKSLHSVFRAWRTRIWVRISLRPLPGSSCDPLHCRGQRNIENYFCLTTRFQWFPEVWNRYTSVSQLKSQWREYMLAILTFSVEKSQNFFLRRQFIHREKRLGSVIMINHFNFPSCRCQQRRERHLRVTVGSCQDD